MVDKYPGARRAAILVTCAVVLQAAEAFLPRVPVPGIRLGLANVITLIAMTEFGFWGAVEVAAVRTVAASLLLGTFLSPAFLISFVSAVSSAVVMAGIYELIKKSPKPFISITGISILGAGVHNAAQLYTVYLVLIRNDAVFMLAPWLGLSAVITGFITGHIAARVCLAGLAGTPAKAVKKRALKAVPVNKYYPKWEINAAHLIFLMTLFAVSVFIFQNGYFYALSFALLVPAAALAGTGIRKTFIVLYKARYLLIFSFLVPVFFTPGGAAVFESGPLRLSLPGLIQGGLFSARIALLMMSSSLLCAILPPGKLAGGMEAFLRHFEFLGFNAGRFSAILVASWINFPGYWEMAGITAKKHGDLVKAGKTGLITAAGMVVTEIIMTAEEYFI